MNPLKILTLTAAAGLAIVCSPTPVAAQAEPILGQLSLFATPWCPRNWHAADGELLPIAQYSALFSLFGTTYGGDGRTTFALPDLRDRAPVSHSRNNRIGSAGGSAGGSQTDPAQRSVLALNWCVATSGIYPSRS